LLIDQDSGDYISLVGVRTIVFDMDGTIIDSKDAYMGTLLEALESYGFRREDVEGLIVPSIRGTVERILREDEELVTGIELKIRKDIVKRADGVDLCPGALSVLGLVGRYKLGLMTGSPLAFVEKVLSKYDLGDVFDQIITVDQDFSSKEDKYVHILKLLQTDPGETVLVGDTKSDVRVAKGTGSRSVAVYNEYSWSWPHKEQLIELEPDLIVTSIEEFVSNCLG